MDQSNFLWEFNIHPFVKKLSSRQNLINFSKELRYSWKFLEERLQQIKLFQLWKLCPTKYLQWILKIVFCALCTYLLKQNSDVY